jgi:hypothetical protein
MDKGPSRTPEDYTPTPHYLQRKKYRTNPEIPDYIPEMAIRDGTWNPQYTHFKIITRVGGKPHEFTLGVDPDEMTVVSVYCFCHLEDGECRPYDFHDRG